MALPYVFRVTCLAIDPWPAVTEVAAASSYAFVRFGKAAAESSDDDMQIPEIGITGELTFRIHQAQKDDFTVGSDYDIDITAA